MDNEKEAFKKSDNGNLRKNTIVKNILKVSLSNIIQIISGVLVGFLLPKMLSVTDYGYFKTFTLYATYVGLFHFGIADGIYLKYGGCSFDELDKTKFRFYSKFFAFFEFFIALLIAAISIFTLPSDLRFIFIFLAIFLFFNNITNYFQIISQITGKFNELSLRNIIQSFLTIAFIISLFLMAKFSSFILSYKIYTIIHVSITVFLSIWYIFTYRKIVFGKSLSLKYGWKDILYFIKIGFPLLIANLASSLIMTLDRQFVNILFDTEVYAIYAFAYNMLNLVTTATSAISTVLYPYLKKESDDSLKENYSRLCSYILILVFFMIISYYPLCFIVDNFLPKYHDSLIIFRVIFPGLAISSVITIVMHNYYKTTGKNFLYFIKTLIILAISIIANLIAYFLFKTPISISRASIITILLWYYYIEFYFVKTYKVKWIKNSLYMIISILVFYCITFIENYYIGFFVHLFIFLAITAIFYWKDIRLLLKMKHRK